ncbi:hypothetical protein BST61_g6250 [Cercospora zeina]
MYWIPDDHVEILENNVSTGSWHARSCTIAGSIAQRRPHAPSEPSVLLGFLTTRKTNTLADTNAERHQKLSTAFAIPPWLWQSKEQDANGYFFGSSVQTPGDSAQANHVSVFRFVVKYVTATKATPAGRTTSVRYDWHIMTFVVSKKASNAVVLLCFDTPTELRKQLSASVKDSSAEDFAEHPFHLHAFVLQAVVELYDHALWQFRDLVRALEHGRPTIDDPDPDYVAIDELARHVLHSSEVLSTALNVVGNMIDELGRYSSIHPPRGATANDPGSVIRHQRSMLQFMHNRALALESRLKNEISLAFHITAQHTSLALTPVRAVRVMSTSERI